MKGDGIMKKYILKAAAFILALLLPFVLCASLVLCIPNQYDATFLAALAPKYERLNSVKGNKVVVIGGSNIAFGLDSEKMEEYVGMPCVNFGLYATLGTKAMLELSRGGISHGDIVIICPETDAQTYSLYFDAKSMWQALESKPSMLFSLESDEVSKVIAAFPEHYRAKLNYFLTGTTPNPDGVYRSDSFNEYGDIEYERRYNDMLTYRDETTTVTLSPSIVSEDFVDYLNRYAKRMALRGAKVYFSFPPINEAALAKGTDADSIYEFYSYLSDKLDFEIISDINEYILDSEYFYDTNYHLNDTGVEYRTSLLASDILRTLGKTDRQLSLSFPMAPIRPDDYFGYNRDDDKTGFFEYEIEGDNAILVGLTDKGAEEELLIMPISYEGRPVISIAANAFSKSTKLERIFVSDNSNLVSIKDGAFDNCPKLKSVELTVPPESLTASYRVFGESASEVNFYVPIDLYAKYATNYEWGALVDRISVM